jgi:hypothetical protein
MSDTVMYSAAPAPSHTSCETQLFWGVENWAL